MTPSIRLPILAALALGTSLVAQVPGPPSEFRSIDGNGNNLGSPRWGSAGMAFERMMAPDYGDGVKTPAGAGRPSPREISNLVAAQLALFDNEAGATDYLWQWGQFLDHDLDLSPTNPDEPFDIRVPLGDPFFDPFSTGQEFIPLNRSASVLAQGVRQQRNVITAFMDASNVYGSDRKRAAALRATDGTGRLLTSDGDLLPFNLAGLPNAPDPSPGFFLAGDERANEQVGLTAMHTLFVREHNYWADLIGVSDDVVAGGQGAGLTPELTYQWARAIVGAEMQAITYNEFLPVLLGPDALEPYDGYDPTLNAGIVNEFAAAAYRVGHTMLSPILRRVGADGNTIPAGDLFLADAFFNPAEIIAEGIDPLLRGLAAQSAQEIDAFVVDDVRNFLFGPPGAGGLDLASLNLQRGRDHGLPSYNAVRIAMGLAPATSFADITSNVLVQTRLAQTYGSVDDVELWIGGLAEDHVNGGVVGETFFTILKRQFEVLRDGDRLWYELTFPDEAVALIEQQTLATIVRRNTDIGAELQDNVFLGN